MWVRSDPWVRADAWGANDDAPPPEPVLFEPWMRYHPTLTAVPPARTAGLAAAAYATAGLGAVLREVGGHHDAVQSTGGVGIRILNNRLEAHNHATGDLMNAAFQFGEERKPLRDCLVAGNLMDGGNYTVNGGGGGTRGAACTFRDNTFEPHFRYGVKGNLGPAVVWESTNRMTNGDPA